MPAAYPHIRRAEVMPTMRLDVQGLIPRSPSSSGVRAKVPAPSALQSLGVSRLEITVAFCAAVVRRRRRGARVRVSRLSQLFSLNASGRRSAS